MEFYTYCRVGRKEQVNEKTIKILSKEENIKNFENAINKTRKETSQNGCSSIYKI